MEQTRCAAGCGAVWWRGPWQAGARRTAPPALAAGGPRLAEAVQLPGGLCAYGQIVPSALRSARAPHCTPPAPQPAAGAVQLGTRPPHSGACAPAPLAPGSRWVRKLRSRAACRMARTRPMSVAAGLVLSSRLSILSCWMISETSLYLAGSRSTDHCRPRSCRERAGSAAPSAGSTLEAPPCRSAVAAWRSIAAAGDC